MPTTASSNSPINVTSRVDQARQAHPLTFFSTLVLDSFDGSILPQARHCYPVTGEVDFVLILNVASLREYQALDRGKVGLKVPIS
ncbi:Lrp/AsnC ligand binding domain-containing protein [Pseudomonas sp. 14P_5.3_Bac1]|uniref:Lrp/AsnC ligand binding domain-containing protein n=1 Tax=Pseudomonas sp. 14P_5.3_Bac1 TaxID=2971622 RepID=UPI003965B40B